MTGSFEVAVLGAGPSGLIAALRLARAGRSVVVLERAGAVGGLAASFEVAGVRVDHGSHRLHRACAPEILAELRCLLGDDLQRRARRGRMRLAGRWLEFPPRAGDLARRLPPAFALRAGRDVLTARATGRRAPARDTFADVVRARLGTTMLEEFYRPYVEKIWGISADELSGELARVRVSAGSGVDLLRRVRRRDPDAATFFYPRRGFGQIVERLADAAGAAGATILTGTDVTAIEPGRSVTTRSGTVAAPLVLSTLPITALPALVIPDAPAEIANAAASLEHRALVLLYLVLERERYTDFDAHYLPGPEVHASRVSEPKRYREGDDPADRTVLCVELPCTVGDVTWRADPPDLAARTLDELARIGLPRTEAVHVGVRRVPNAYPVYRVGFEAALGELDAWARARPGLVSLGRQGLFAHDNTHHALAMGIAAADAVQADGSFDPAAWSAARARFRTHVVED